MKTHYQILIIGGGNAGLSLSARLLRKNSKLDIGILEPSEIHYYQPGWTLVGGGVMDSARTVRDEAGLIPKGAEWIRDGAEAFEPESNTVITKSNVRLTYDYMVVACGIQLNWHEIKGLPETIGKNRVCSNYRFDLAPYTYECIRDFKGGRALFTQPASVIKCGAAPQKIMYLAADNFRRRGIADKSEVWFYTGKPGLLRVKAINEALLKIVNRYGIRLVFGSSLVEIRGEAKEAVFDVPKSGETCERVTVNFDMIHVTPPQSAPDFIRNSTLSVKGDPQGWVDVDMFTLRHKRFGNIFSIGDAANAGDAKTGAAIRIQAPIVARNLLAVMEGKSPEYIDGLPKYDGYTACPLVTGYGRLLMAEFDRDNNLKPSFPLDPTKERLSMWLMMRHVMPWTYWNLILRGKV